MRYRMFVTDFDNTLLRTDHTILDSTWDTIREYERRGGKFVLATGRMLSTIERTIAPFGMHGELIAFQGGVVKDLDTGEILMKRHVAREDALELLSILKEAGYYVQIYDFGKYFVNRYTESTKFYAEFNGLEGVVIGDDMARYVVDNDMHLDKILFSITDNCFDNDERQVAAVIDEMSARFEGRIDFNSSNLKMIESIAHGATKAEAVALVAERNGIAREEVICIGDGMNDATMIEWAGLGVAVANAPDELKAVADVVTVSCDEDAVGTVIREYCLGERQ